MADEKQIDVEFKRLLAGAEELQLDKFRYAPSDAITLRYIQEHLWNLIRHLEDSGEVTVDYWVPVVESNGRVVTISFARLGLLQGLEIEQQPPELPKV